MIIFKYLKCFAILCCIVGPLQCEDLSIPRDDDTSDPVPTASIEVTDDDNEDDGSNRLTSAEEKALMTPPPIMTMAPPVPMDKSKTPKFVLTHPLVVETSRSFAFHLTLFKTTDISLPVVFEATIKDGNVVVAVQTFEQKTWGVQKHVFTAFETSKINLDARPQVSVKFLSNDVHSTNSPLTSGTQVKQERFIFIQTDKAIYKPGQDVKIVVLALNADLSAIKSTAINVSVTDTQKNLIQEVKMAKLNKFGFFELSFTLSTFTNIGEWLIEVVSANDHSQKSPVTLPKTQKTFTVDFYVLPNIEVSLAFNEGSHVVRKTDDKDYVGRVTALYTFGKSAAGSVQVTLLSTGGCNSEYDYPSSRPYGRLVQPGTVLPRVIYKFNIKADDSAKDGEFTLTGLNKLLDPLPFPGLSQRLSCQLRFAVEFTEQVTGRVYKASETAVTIYQYGTAIKALESNQPKVKPGLPYRAYFKVTKADGSPLDRAQTGVQLSYAVYAWSKNNPSHPGVTNCRPTDALYPPDQLPKPILSGKATTDIFDTIGISAENVPADFDQLFFRLSLTSTPGVNLCYSRAKSETKSGKSILVQMDRPLVAPLPKVGEKVSFTVKLTYRSDFAYFILSENGRILLYKHLKKPEKSTDSLTVFKVKVKLSRKLAPRASAIAWAIEPNSSEMLADRIHFDVDGLVQQEVEASFNPAVVSPGAETSLTVKTTDRKSMVMLLATDKRVSLLKSGNRITVSDVLNTLSAGNVGAVRRIGSGAMLRIGCWGGSRGCFPFPNNADDVLSTFRNAKIAIFSNLELSRPRPTLRMMSKSAVSKRIDSIAIAEDNMETSNSANEINVRKNFPETWIWLLAPTDSKGVWKENLIAPDTITTYELHALAVGSSMGFGGISKPAELRIFKDFFVNVEIKAPFIKRYEQVQIKVLVANYKNKACKTEIRVLKSESFQVLLDETDELEAGYDHDDFVKKITVEANKIITVPVWIRPAALGPIAIQVRAKTNSGSEDAIDASVDVEAEGRMFYANKAVLVQLLDAGKFKKTIDVRSMLGNHYQSIVEGSLVFQIQAIGSPLGAAIANLENSLRLPVGCGEQTMSTLAPNVYIYDYLKAVGLLTTELEVRVKSFNQQGYENMLKYQRDDGGFSAFGQRDANSKTWLTTFVAQVLTASRKQLGTNVADTVLQRAFDFIDKQRQDDGTFKEAGPVIHSEMQGGARNAVNLAAYIYLTYAEAGKQISSKVRERLCKAAEDPPNSDAFQLALLSYAFSFRDEDAKLSKDTLKRLLDLSSKIGSDLLYWKPSTDSPKINEYSRLSKSAIETAGYALLALVKQNDLKNGIMVARWLMTQRNSLGGFSSTQDTVVGLKALAAIASKWAMKDDKELTLDTTSLIDEEIVEHSFQVSKHNAVVLQTFDLPRSAQNLKSVTIKALGTGVALVQLSARYNLLKFDSGDIQISNKILTFDLDHEIVIESCLSMKTSNAVGMIVFEMSNPTGLKANFQKTEAENRANTAISRVELGSNGQTVFYFHALPLISSPSLCVRSYLQRDFPTKDIDNPMATAYCYYAVEKCFTSIPVPFPGENIEELVERNDDHVVIDENAKDDEEEDDDLFFQA